MRSAADDVQMTCVHADNVQVRTTCADDNWDKSGSTFSQIFGLIYKLCELKDGQR